MTHKELAQKITRGIIAKAQTQPDPVAWFARAAARAYYLDERAKISGDATAELFIFAQEFGLLPAQMTVEN
jgi:hypothetical protein